LATWLLGTTLPIQANELEAKDSGLNAYVIKNEPSTILKFTMYTGSDPNRS
jgi:hypothetical protein